MAKNRLKFHLPSEPIVERERKRKRSSRTRWLKLDGLNWMFCYEIVLHLPPSPRQWQQSYSLNWPWKFRLHLCQHCWRETEIDCHIDSTHKLCVCLCVYVHNKRLVHVWWHHMQEIHAWLWCHDTCRGWCSIGTLCQKVTCTNVCKQCLLIPLMINKTFYYGMPNKICCSVRGNTVRLPTCIDVQTADRISTKPQHAW